MFAGKGSALHEPEKMPFMNLPNIVPPFTNPIRTCIKEKAN